MIKPIEYQPGTSLQLRQAILEEKVGEIISYLNTGGTLSFHTICEHPEPHRILANGRHMCTVCKKMIKGF